MLDHCQASELLAKLDALEGFITGITVDTPVMNPIRQRDPRNAVAVAYHLEPCIDLDSVTLRAMCAAGWTFIGMQELNAIYRMTGDSRRTGEVDVSWNALELTDEVLAERAADGWVLVALTAEHAVYERWAS